MNLLVSVVVPVYNKAKYLKACLESLIKQSYSNLEIIIIDDGSTDKSPSIIKQMLLKDNRIRFYSQENQGVASARNKGIELAKGDYLFFMDADDRVKNNTIELLMNEVTNSSADIVVSNFNYVNEGKLISKTSYKQQYVDSKSNNLIQTKADMFLLNGKPLSSVCNKLYRVNFIKEFNIKFRNQILAEDRMFNLECYLNNPIISVLEEVTYFINIVQNSRSRSFNRNYLSESIRSVYVLNEIYESENRVIEDRELIQLTLITEIEKILDYYYFYSQKKFSTIYNIILLLRDDNLIYSTLKDIVYHKTLRKIKGNKKYLFRLKLFSYLISKGLISLFVLCYVTYQERNKLLYKK